ncbi:hypothetical protein TNCV_1433711 [Trichonephila clavipes]|nr:hypothetical protein TNCV_1433711 [Trichonephila clavipes]
MLATFDPSGHNCSNKNKFFQVKSYFRTSTGQDRLSELGILSIEVDEVKKLESSSAVDVNVNAKPNKKKLRKKRKNKAKESTEEFIFPQKTARPISPTSTQDTIETNNHFSDLEQDVEHPLSTEKQVITEVVTPKKTLPTP